MNLDVDCLYSMFIGIGETLWLASASLIGGLFLGIILAIFQTTFKNSFFQFVLLKTTDFFQSLPETLLLFFVYFGGSFLLSALCKKEMEISAFLACAFTLSVVLGIYASKVFTMAFAHIVQGEKEAAYALKLSTTKTFLHIILPQVWHHALPGLGNLWLIVLKDTALISLIGGSDLMSRTQIITRNTQQPFTYYGVLACIYLCLTYSSEYGIKRIRKHG